MRNPRQKKVKYFCRDPTRYDSPGFKNGNSI